MSDPQYLSSIHSFPYYGFAQINFQQCKRPSPIGFAAQIIDGPKISLAMTLDLLMIQRWTLYSFIGSSLGPFPYTQQMFTTTTARKVRFILACDIW